MNRYKSFAATLSFVTLASISAITLGAAVAGSSALAAAKDAKATHPEVSNPANTTIHVQSIKKLEMDAFLKDYSTAISIIVSLVGGVITYSVNESWKRRQYVEEKIKEFEEKPEAIVVRKILSTELQCVELFPFESEPKHRFMIVKDCLWTDALLECKCNLEIEKEYQSIDKSKPLYKQEAAVKAVTRDNFNRFLDYLQQFEKMIKSGVVSRKNLENYLDPWFELISRADEREIIICSISHKEYVPKKALLEYMGLLEEIPESELSVVQKDVRALVMRYRPLSSFLSNNEPREAEQPSTNLDTSSLSSPANARC